MMRRTLFLLWAILAPFSVADAAINTIGPFTGQFSEGFEGETQVSPEISVFDEQVIVKGLVSQVTITRIWNSHSNGKLIDKVTPHSGEFFMGSAYRGLEWVFDKPALQFGGYFTALNVITNDEDAVATFFDTEDNPVGQMDVIAPFNNQWTWNGWLSDAPIKRVQIIGLGYGGGFVMYDDMEYTPIPEPVTIDIDIKPGSCPNPLNVKSKGVLPVTILGSEDFDVNTIDAASIRLAGVAPIRSSYEDVAAPVWDRQDECECTTEGPDGYLDLTLKFETEEIVNALGEVTDGEELVLTLSGTLYDETPIEGEDCILVISKRVKAPEPTTTPTPSPSPTIETVIEIDPDTLNLKSKGRWITCYIWLPEGYDVDDVDTTTIVLKKDDFEVGGEYGEFQTGKLMVKFPRSQVQDILEPGEVELTVTGELVDGTKFGGSDTIRVINKGGKK